MTDKEHELVEFFERAIADRERLLIENERLKKRIKELEKEKRELNIKLN